MKDISIKGKQVPAVLVGLLLIFAGAGAAAGVTVQGNVQGDTTTKVDQAILAEEVTETTGNVNNALGTVSDDGTAFKFSANVNQGDEYRYQITLRNAGEQALNGRLELAVPDPLEIEVHGSDGISAARMSMSTWMLDVDSGAVDKESVGTAQTHTTTEPVVDSNDDGQITMADLTFVDRASSEDISVASVNSDGTVVLESGCCSTFDQKDSISYESQQTVTITVATPDDIEPGFYKIEGKITPKEV